MTIPADDILAVAFGYLSGSIPFAHLVSRVRGIDLRRVGSGNVGASNVLRTSGVRLGVAAMCLDALKGALAVLLAARMSSSAGVPVAAGVASVLGHVYPVWLRFRGGKGVATAAGVFAVLAPWPLVGACGVFLACVWITRYISLGSLAATVALAGMSTVEDNRMVPIGAAISALLIVLRHRANLSRLLKGTERRIGQRLTGVAASKALR
jgi:glycerol-3-phosphate acyltransferase PlsY